MNIILKTKDGMWYDCNVAVRNMQHTPFPTAIVSVTQCWHQHRQAHDWQLRPHLIDTAAADSSDIGICRA